jgi:hypothetical protein
MLRSLYFCFLLFWCQNLSAQAPSEHSVKSLRQFTASLDESQKAKVFYPFENVERLDWNILPVADKARPGLAIKAMTEKQQQLLEKVLRSWCSELGYLKLQQIVALENVLREMEGPARRDPDQYCIAVFGNLGSELWGWKFEGHHISLNFTIVDGKIACEPWFFGANPAEVRQGAQKGTRVLAKEEDLALALINTLDEQQRKAAVLKPKTDNEIATRDVSEIKPIDPPGLGYEKLNNTQQKQLIEIIHTYLASMPDDLAKTRQALIDKNGFQNVTFAWTGTLDRSSGHYYRIQGPSFLIEFDNSQNNANHIHAVWRDFKGDFGRDLLREHYQAMHKE